MKLVTSVFYMSLPMTMIVGNSFKKRLSDITWSCVGSNSISIRWNLMTWCRKIELLSCIGCQNNIIGNRSDKALSLGLFCLIIL